MKTKLIPFACLLLALPGLLSAQDDLSWMRGANYVPSYARNNIQQWMEYDPAVIDRELGYAERLKLNTVRVFLNVAVFEKQPEKFLADFENFVGLADKHGLKVMPVLFDSCFDPQEVDVNNYKGKNWIPSPGFPRLGDKDWPTMENFIAAVVGKYRDDKRIVLWDVMNEPESTGQWRKPEGKKVIVEFLRRALRRTREEKPLQPIGIGWAGPGNNALAADLSDVLLIHHYPHMSDDMATTIGKIKEMAKQGNKLVVINEFLARPKQRVENVLPVIAKEKIGWVFWELMIGSTQFSEEQMPYRDVPFQGHLHPDGTCFLPTEIAAILHPEGFTGNATEIAQAAGFVVSDKTPKKFVENPDAIEVLHPFTEESVGFSPGWTRRNGKGPVGERLWDAKIAGETATKEVTGTSLAVVLKHGPDGGMATVTIDGKPAAVPEIDTYAKDIDWNRMTVVAQDLPPGKHTVVVTVTGRKADAAKDCLVQLVDFMGSETGVLDPASGPSAVRIEKDVAFLSPDRAEKADLYLPGNLPADAKAPVVLWIHGGGFWGGDKAKAREINMGINLASHGYVCMSINYALNKRDFQAFPQNLHDCKTAVRWLRANAERLRIDPLRIAVAGGSAGGYLASMVALTRPEDGFDPKGPYGEYPCTVQCGVNFYGCDSKNSKTSMGTYARKDSPPMLIVHGTADKIVLIKTSEMLHEALKNAGADVQFESVPGAQHGFHLQPKERDLRPPVFDFLDKHLKGKSTP